MSTQLLAIIPTEPPPAGGEGIITNPFLGPNLQLILQTEGGVGFFRRFLPSLIGLILVAGVVIFLFMMLIGAIQWISSGGDKANVESARGRITNALIGLVIMLSVFAVMLLIETFFHINILTLDIGVLKIK